MEDLNAYLFESDLKNASRLIQDGMDINGKSSLGIRPISAAINSDDPKTLAFVIGQGADVNIDFGGPLHECIDYCIDGMIQNNRSAPYPESLEMLKLLVDKGADWEIKNNAGERPIDVISAYAHNDASLERLKSFFRPIIPLIDQSLKAKPGNL